MGFIVLFLFIFFVYFFFGWSLRPGGVRPGGATILQCLDPPRQALAAATKRWQQPQPRPRPGLHCGLGAVRFSGGSSLISRRNDQC